MNNEIELKLMTAVTRDYKHDLARALRDISIDDISEDLSKILLDLMIHRESTHVLPLLIEFGIVDVTEVAFQSMRECKSIIFQALLFERYDERTEHRLKNICADNYARCDTLIQTVIDVNSRDVCPFDTNLGDRFTQFRV